MTAAPQVRVQAVMRAERKIVFTDTPVIVRKSGDLSIVHEADTADGRLMVYDGRMRAWRPVVLPPGTRWELAEKRSGPLIFLPPGVRR